MAARLDGQHQEDPVPHTIRYSVGDNRIDLVCDDGETSRLWWATKNEWLGLIDIAGLELEALYGGFVREPFADDSQEYVFVARRPVSDVADVFAASRARLEPARNRRIPDPPPQTPRSQVAAPPGKQQYSQVGWTAFPIRV